MFRCTVSLQTCEFHAGLWSGKVVGIELPCRAPVPLGEVAIDVKGVEALLPQDGTYQV